MTQSVYLAGGGGHHHHHHHGGGGWGRRGGWWGPTYYVESSPCNCPTIYAPVVGADGRGYANECLAQCAGTRAVRRLPSALPGLSGIGLGESSSWIGTVSGPAARADLPAGLDVPPAGAIGLSPQRAIDPQSDEMIIVPTRWVQRALVAAGYQPGTVDGRAGPLTMAALENWHEAHGGGSGPFPGDTSATIEVSRIDEARLSHAVPSSAGTPAGGTQLPPSASGGTPAAQAATNVQLSNLLTTWGVLALGCSAGIFSYYLWTR